MKLNNSIKKGLSNLLSHVTLALAFTLFYPLKNWICLISGLFHIAYCKLILTTFLKQFL